MLNKNIDFDKSETKSKIVNSKSPPPPTPPTRTFKKINFVSKNSFSSPSIHSKLTFNILSKTWHGKSYILFEYAKRPKN